MNASFTIDTSPFDRLIDSLDSGTDPSKEGPMREAMYESSDAYHQAMRERFAAASAHDGTWAEHAPSTVKKRGQGAPILHEGGELELSLNRGAEGHVLRAEGDAVEEGTDNRVAGFQHNGTKTIPARTILIDPTGETLGAMKTPLVQGVKAAVGQT